MAKYTHKAEARCSTCGLKVKVDIPKRAAGEEYLINKVVYPICGCKTCGLGEEG